ncbi:MAG TPA: phosphoribosylamine--glycine ligase [Stellaceae bacterium]|nr:phosphoribosylamine--glycine ligase [Stellaceae bacterium]
MRVLIVGSGGREHALSWAIAGSPLADQVYCAPGNAGIAEDAECVAIDADDTPGLIGFCKKAAIDFVVVGPEAPLVAGLVDVLETAGIAAFGPRAKAAALEGSKAFMKELCAGAGIPTAAYRRFVDPAAAAAYIAARGAPIVVKADGLAAGKGVVVAPSVAAAQAAVDAALGQRRFGAAGAEIVIEDYLAGEEASFFALVDGERALPLASAQDYKRAHDSDAGPNTGGMGACSPTPAMTPALEGEVMEKMILPTVRAMARAGRPFNGVLYAGLMLTDEGPKLLEYNVRFGDPECQVLMMRLKSDLLPALIACRDGILGEVDLRWYDDSALCVILAANGYPEPVTRGGDILGLDAAASDPDVKIFHAATRRDNGRLVADGGRVLGVTALGKDVGEARARAYRAVDRIRWPDGFCRRDIGLRPGVRSAAGGAA